GDELLADGLGVAIDVGPAFRERALAAFLDEPIFEPALGQGSDGGSDRALVICVAALLMESLDGLPAEFFGHLAGGLFLKPGNHSLALRELGLGVERPDRAA